MGIIISCHTKQTEPNLILQLPDDLIYHIFSYIDTIQLLQTTNVSKHWYQLLTNDTYCKQMCKQSLQKFDWNENEIQYIISQNYLIHKNYYHTLLQSYSLPYRTYFCIRYYDLAEQTLLWELEVVVADGETHCDWRELMKGDENVADNGEIKYNKQQWQLTKLQTYRLLKLFYTYEIDKLATESVQILNPPISFIFRMSPNDEQLQNRLYAYQYSKSDEQTNQSQSAKLEQQPLLHSQLCCWLYSTLQCCFPLQHEYRVCYSTRLLSLSFFFTTYSDWSNLSLMNQHVESYEQSFWKRKEVNKRLKLRKREKCRMRKGKKMKPHRGMLS